MSICDASNILVLDANQRSALAVTRSLGRNPSLQVWTADCVHKSLAGSSRYSRGYLRCPSPQNQPKEFLLWLSDAISYYGFSAVFPVTEISSQLLLMNQASLGECRLPFADYPTVMSLADKGKLLASARALGVPVPDYSVYEWHQQPRNGLSDGVSPASIQGPAGTSRSGSHRDSPGFDGPESERPVD